MNDILENFNKLNEVEKRALLYHLQNVETVRMFLEWTHQKKAHSKLKKDDLSDFVGHCEEIESWFAKTELWNKVFNGQTSIDEHDVYLELVINAY